jgi:hypothetical protein
VGESIWVDASTAPNNPVERTAHSAGSVARRGFVPVGRRSPGALGDCVTVLRNN